MKIPNILLVNDLLGPINDLVSVIDECVDEIKSTSSLIVEKSIFSYVMSLFEIIQTEILVYILCAIPEKIKKPEFKINKEELLTDLFQIRREKVELYVQGLSYKNINEYLDDFFEILSINPITSKDKELLVEVKATRNLLLHNNLKMNNTYQNKAGPQVRKADFNGYLPLPKKYILSSVSLIKRVILHIQKEINLKYSKYNKKYVLKNIWEYLFDSPVLKYDDFWQSDNGLIRFKKSTREFKQMILDGYSSSEVILLFLWMNHFNSAICDKCFEPRFLNTYALDSDMRNKYMFLNNIIINYPDLFKT